MKKLCVNPADVVDHEVDRLALLHGQLVDAAAPSWVIGERAGQLEGDRLAGGRAGVGRRGR